MMKKIFVLIFMVSMMMNAQTIYLDSGNVIVEKVSPGDHNFYLLCSNEMDLGFKTARQWGEQYKLDVVINAGMYRDNGKSVGYMRNYDYVSNPTVNKYNAILVFNPKYSSLPEVMIVDRECQDWATIIDSYHSCVQGIRMIDCRQKNRWKQQEKRHTISAVGVDMEGNVLFMYCKVRMTVHDFIDIILNSSLEIDNAVYMDGSVPASLYTKEVSYSLYPIPNVIGVTKK